MAQKKAKTKKPTVGLFISELENAYTYNLCRGVIDAAKKNDTNLVIFPGKSPKAPYEFQYQFNSIYELPQPSTIDALILATGTMINFLSPEEFVEFYKRYSKIPLVSISIPLNNISSVLIDNEVGLKQALLHLITVHRFRRIAFIRGPENNAEAQERFSVYKKVLAENKIPFDKDLVCQGDFTHYSSVSAINRLISNKVKFDAVAAANDEMALSAINILKSHGLKVPHDVAVIGFDNVESARFSSPSLTTVSQPIYEQAGKAFHMAMDLIKSKRVGNYTLGTEMVIRESCGCISEMVNSINLFDRKKKAREGKKGTPYTKKDAFVYKPQIGKKIEQMLSELGESGNKDRFRAFIDRFAELLSGSCIEEDDILAFQNLITELRHDLLSQAGKSDLVCKMEDFFHQARVLLMEAALKINSRRWTLHHNDIRSLRIILNLLISNIYNREETLQTIIPHLKEMGISSCYIYLFDEAIIHSITDSWRFPPAINVAMYYGNSAVSDMLIVGGKLPTKGILKKEFFSDQQHTLVVSPLFYMDEQLGFIIAEMDLLDIYLFESLAVEISCALKLTYLIKTRQEIEDKLRFALMELEEYNKRLNDISQTDELTGLLNRRGFLYHSRHDLNIARRMKKDGLLFFADLDKLKQINDTYGHNEGDNAIKAVANVLQRTFRESDIMARIGGDEFTIFTINTSLEMIDNFKKRINLFVEEHNRNSGKPYKVSISIGAVPFSSSGIENIESLLNQADILLYNQKRMKKKHQKH